MLDALRQDHPVRNKQTLSQQSSAWPPHTKLFARAKALALLGVLYYILLPITVTAALARAALAWLFSATPAAVGGHDGKDVPSNGHSSHSRGTALVSGAFAVSMWQCSSGA